MKQTQDNSIEVLQGLLFHLEEAEKACVSSNQLGTMNEVDMANNIAMIRKQKFDVTKKLVDAVHVRNDGEVLSIWKHEPTRGYSDGYWATKTKGGLLKKSKSLESLYDILYKHYYGDTSTTYTVGKVFLLALDEKSRCMNPCELTILRNRNDYKRLISSEFAEKDITQITDEDIQEYTQQLVLRLELTRHAFFDYKGILNLIFNYALSHGLIRNNPVLSIVNERYLKSCNTSKSTAEESTISEEDKEKILAELKRREALPKRYKDCFGYAHAIRFSLLTGAREGEIVAFKWKDIDWVGKEIRIHSQQVLRHDEDGHVVYVLVNHTKNERGISRGGRPFPLSIELIELLKDAKAKQEELGIEPDFVFTHADGSWLTTSEYTKYFGRLCRKLGLKATNNHAIRKGFNSYVLLKNGIPVTDRARLLGHSTKVNLEHYSFEDKEYVSRAKEILDKSQKGTILSEKGTKNPIPFTKRKSPKPLSL